MEKLWWFIKIILVKNWSIESSNNSVYQEFKKVNIISNCLEDIEGISSFSYDVNGNGNFNSWKDYINGLGSVIADTNGPDGYKVVFFSYGFEGISSERDRFLIMKRIIDYLTGPETLNTKLYVRSLDNQSWEEFNVTCDPSQSYCLRKMNPIINATCINYQLFGTIKGAEYNLSGIIGNMLATDGNFDEKIEIVNGSINVSSLADGTYVINVHCKDSDNYWGKFDNISFEVDTTKPSTGEIIIENGKKYTKNEKIEIEFSLDYPTYQPDFIRFSCNNQNWTNWIPYQQTYLGFNITDLKYGCNSTDGNKTIYTQVRDIAGNYLDYPQNWVILDRKSPKINQIYPQDNNWLNTTNITFIFNFTDAISPKANCSLYLDETLNQTNSSVLNNTNTDFNVLGLSEGQHIWNITCIDKAGNLNSSKRYLNIDTKPPTITIENPIEGETYSGVVNLLTTISDLGVGVDEAWYEIRNSTNLSQIFAQGNLTAANDWDATWNSSEVTNSTGNFTFIVYANDSLRWKANKNISFKVDNNKPSATIVFPKKIYLNYNFNLSLKAERPNGNITNASYWIYNSSNELIVSNTTQPNSPSFEFTDFINISNWQDGNYTIIFNVTDGTNNASDSSWFYIDKTPPSLSNWSLNIEDDLNYGNKRIYDGEEVIFSVNVSEEVKQVDEVIVTIIFPNALSYNYTLEPENNNYTQDRWSFSFFPVQFGTYNITKIFANDSLGNLNEIDINLNFIVVKPSIKINFEGDNEIDAGQNSSFNLSFNFNKTVSNQSLILYIPSYYSNLSAWNCTNCSLVNNQLNLTSDNNITTIKLQTNLLAGIPEQDINSTWNLEFRGENYSSWTKIKTPLLNLSILCNGNSSCVVNQSQSFNLTVIVYNLKNENHTGNSYNINLTFSCFDLNITNSTIIENLTSGSNSSYNWSYNITKAGNFSCIYLAIDRNNYIKQVSKNLIVVDREPPQIISTYWEEDNIFNINESAILFVHVEDNVKVNSVWAEINNTISTSNQTLTYDIYEGSYKLNYSNTTIPGNYTIIRIFANDSSGNLGNLTLNLPFEIRELNLSSSLNSTILINKTQTIRANISGNGSVINLVQAIILKPNSEIDQIELDFVKKENEIYSFKANYINTTLSGNYTINLTVTLTSGVSKSLELNFSIPYGNLSMEPEVETLYLTINKTYNFSWFIYPINGDLINVTTILEIENTTIINLTEVKTKNLGNIGWVNYYSGYVVKYNLNATNLGNTSITLLANSTIPKISLNKTINVFVIDEDSEAPIIHNFGNLYSNINLFEPNLIWINATDNKTIIGDVLIEIKYPSNLTRNLTAIKDGNLFKYYFKANETGTYYYRVFAIDVAGNIVNSSYSNFTAFDKYQVIVSTEYDKYNRGNRVLINVSVKNINNQSINNYNLTIILDKAGTNYTILNNTIANSVTYYISEEDPVPREALPDKYKIYKIYAEVSKNNNFGNGSVEFKVYKLVYVDILYPPEGMYFSPGSKVNLEVEITNIRGEKYTQDIASVIAYCQDCIEYYIPLQWNETTERYISNSFTAPQKDIFSISFGAVDKDRNTDLDGAPPYVVLTTQTSQLTQEGGSTSSQGVTDFITQNCTCTDWNDQGCGAGNCKFDEMLQIRSCSPAGCAIEERCIFKPICIPEKNFDISLSKQEIKIEQGKDEEIFLNLINTGKVSIDINISLNKECCEINFTNYINLSEKERVSLPIKIHSKLSQPPGKFSISFNASGGGIEKEVILRIIIESNALITYLSKVKKEIPIIENQLIKFNKLGINVKELVKKLEEIKIRLKKCDEAINRDDIDTLEAEVSKIRTNFEYIKFQILTLKIQEFLLENKLMLIAMFFVILIILYYITQVIIPYLRLKKEIRELRSKGEDLVETRKATEKQFFTRKIDEPTFRNIIAKTQQQILKNRSEIKNKLAELSLLKKNLNPLLMIKWILYLPIFIFKKIKSRLKKIKDRVQFWFKIKKIEKKFEKI